MTLFRDKYRIESARKPGWDYSWLGWYFVTICTENKRCVFGKVSDDVVHLSPLGAYVASCWREIPGHYSKVEIDEFIVMPNHMHGIVVITGDNPVPELRRRGKVAPAKTLAEVRPKSGSLSNVVGSFKSAVSYWCGTQHPGFGWQARFHDRIIRGDKALQAMREYIRNNPANWLKDEFFVA
jgi:REP element-mobilizing transposase RayT